MVLLLWVFGITLMLGIMAAILFCRIRVRIHIEANPKGTRYSVSVKIPLVPRHFQVGDPAGFLRKLKVLGKRSDERFDERSSERFGERSDERSSGRFGEQLRTCPRKPPRTDRGMHPGLDGGKYPRTGRPKYTTKDRRKRLSSVLQFPGDFLVDEFTLSLRVGTGDASKTALLSGALRGAAGGVLSVVSRCGVRFAQKPVVRLVPSFDSVVLSLVANAQISFRLYKFVGVRRR